MYHNNRHNNTQLYLLTTLTTPINMIHTSQGFKLPLSSRPQMRALLGGRAERLAWIFCMVDRKSVDATLTLDVPTQDQSTHSTQDQSPYNMHIHIYTYSHINIYIHSHIQTYTYLCTYLHTYTHIYTHTHIKIYTYTHTNIHILCT
jgi:hypothetical protein